MTLINFMGLVCGRYHLYGRFTVCLLKLPHLARPDAALLHYFKSKISKFCQKIHSPHLLSIFILPSITFIKRYRLTQQINQ